MSFERIDRHTSKVSKTDEASFESLIKYLEKGISQYESRDKHMARALIVWFSLKHVEEDNDSDETFSDSDSPYGIIRDLKCKKLSFPEVYKTLCSKANIECKIIQGISRSGDYLVGDTDYRKLDATWNAVRINNQWQLVYPRWVVQSVKGAIAKGIVLEEEGQKINKDEAKSFGTLEKHFNDFWFLTDPLHFVNKCFPNEPKWQLLPMAKTQKSQVAFLKQPNYTHWAFKYGLRLVRRSSCILSTNNGFCLIEMKASSENCRTEMTLSGKLKLLSSVEAYDMKKNFPNLTQYFPPTSAKKRIYGFNIRFPVEGKYHFTIKAGPRKDRVIRHVVCDFLIVCKQPMEDFKPLPFEAGEVGWAPGPEATDAGLTEPSVTEPNVKIKPKSDESPNTRVDEVAEFVFKVDKGVWKLYDYETVMFGSDYLDDEEHTALQGHVDVRNDKKENTLNIKASVPKEGEYAVVIKTVPKETTNEPKVVCNYMLTTLETASDEVLSEESDYSSDEEFKEMKTKLRKVREEKRHLEETKHMLLSKINE